MTGTELLTGITELTTNDPERAPGLARLTDAAIVIEGDRIVWTGAAASAPAADRRTHLGGRAVLPGWVDSHTHLVFAGDRSTEFEQRMAGVPYQAGGIRATVEATRAATDAQLLASLRQRRAVALTDGTTTIEVKTGYGLDVAQEARLARIAREITEEVTFLGAHVVPEGVSQDDYVAQVTGPMLEAVRPWVRWIDVFCEQGAFDEGASKRVLAAGAAAGLGLRVHGNQLRRGAGVLLAVEMGAAAVDHVNHLDDDDVAALGASSTVATLLPACDLSTRQPFPPARALLDAGATIAIASNGNPGTSHTTSVAYCVATAVLQMRLTVEEAVWAATAGGAQALSRWDDPDPVGRIAPGARADLQVLDAPSVSHLAYRPGMRLTSAVWKEGIRVLS